jgi:hypothetical protein
MRAFLLEAQATFAIGVLAALVEDQQISQASVSACHTCQLPATTHGRATISPAQQLARALYHDLQVFVRSTVPASLMRYARRCANSCAGIAVVHASSSSTTPATDDATTAAVSAAAERLRARRRSNVVLALTYLGDYLECLGLLLHVSTPIMPLLAQGDS